MQNNLHKQIYFLMHKYTVNSLNYFYDGSSVK